MTDVTELHFNPLDPQLAVDPYPVYRSFREVTPLLYEEALGMCFVWGHEEARHVLREPSGDLRFVQFQRGRLPGGKEPADQPYCQGLADFVVAKNGADHRRVRGAFSRNFTPARVESLLPQARIVAAGLIDSFHARGETELMETFAIPLPLSVISSLFGIGEEDTRRIANYLLYFTRAIQFLPMTEEDLALVNDGFTSLKACFAEIIDQRRVNPGDDFLSALVAEADAGNLTEGELSAASWGLYAAGHETTAGVIGLSLLTLLEYPEQLEALRREPERIPEVVEEILRFRGLTQAVHRIFPEPFELAGQMIPAGTPVVVYVAAANRDERWCSHGETFDIDRDNSPRHHLSFSDGPHKCPGQHLARSTLIVALETLLPRLPGLRLNGEVDWDQHNLPLIPPKRIPVAWDV